MRKTEEVLRLRYELGLGQRFPPATSKAEVANAPGGCPVTANPMRNFPLAYGVQANGADNVAKSEIRLAWPDTFVDG